jgi:hypothetical protein
MKPFEEAFASELFRRVILPGIILSAGVHPMISGYLSALKELYGLGPTSFIVAEVIVLGLVVSSAIQQIYYIYEGFRLGWLTWAAGKLIHRRFSGQKRRLKSIEKSRNYDDLNQVEQQEVSKIYEYLGHFPLQRQSDGSFDYFVDRPTRLGNVIATYELYPESRYGVDGVDFWNHFLNLASDTTRKAFEDKYSFAEGMVLASFSGALVFVLHLSVLLGFAIRTLVRTGTVFNLPGVPVVSAWLTLFGVATWLLFYLCALPAHAEAGAAFRAIVDLTFRNFSAWAIKMKVPPKKATVDKIAQLDQYLKRPHG